MWEEMPGEDNAMQEHDQNILLTLIWLISALYTGVISV